MFSLRLRWFSFDSLVSYPPSKAMHVSSIGNARSPVGTDDKVNACVRADSATKLRRVPAKTAGNASSTLSAGYVVVEDGWIEMIYNCLIAS